MPARSPSSVSTWVANRPVACVRSISWGDFSPITEPLLKPMGRYNNTVFVGSGVRLPIAMGARAAGR